jgi:hydrogenase 3 maturation protease
MASSLKFVSRAKKIPSAKSLKAGWREAVSRELRNAGRLFVLGVGNRHKGDDAAGSLCVRLLKRELARGVRRAGALGAESARPLPAIRKRPVPGVLVLDAGDAPESATGKIRKLGPTHVLIVDAAVGGHRPGTIFLVDKKKIRQEEVSTHRLPLSLLVRYLEESIGCRVILIGIEPEEVAWGKPVSAVVKASAARLAAWLEGILTSRRP